MVHMNFPPEIRMDQWHSKFSESFSLDRYWSIECSSLTKGIYLHPECTAVAAIQLRMRMRILTGNSLANFSHQISNKQLRIGVANGFANEIVEISFSLRKLLANGILRQKSLALRMRWLSALSLTVAALSTRQARELPW